MLEQVSAVAGRAWGGGGGGVPLKSRGACCGEQKRRESGAKREGEVGE